jgi:hypothetical protein
MPCSTVSQSRLSEDLTGVIRACATAGVVRACLLATRDRDHALALLKSAVHECGQPLYHFSVAGRRQYDFTVQQWRDIRIERLDGHALLREADAITDGGVVVLESAAILLREEGDAAMRIRLAQMLSSETKRRGMVLVFLEAPEAERHLPSIVADQFVRLHVPYPRAEELDSLARHEIALIGHQARLRLDLERIQTEASHLSSELAGLTRSAARDALRDALAPDPGDFESAFARLQRRKGEHLGHELAMNVLDSRDAEMPIGLDYLVEHLAIDHDRMRLHGSQRARGILLIGPPGVGKTMLARAVGKLVELPVVEFRISSLMNSLLGETERRFAQAFETLAALSPSVVFLDEIEKAFSSTGSEQDGGTMMRVTGSLLSWLSDNPYPNYIVATGNSLRMMGEVGLTMTRSERFDAAFFVDVPNLPARRRMLERWLNGRLSDSAGAAARLAADTARFSGADLHSVVKRAAARAEHDGEDLQFEHISDQVERKRNRVLALYGEFDGLRSWAKVHCEPAGPGEEGNFEEA